MNMTVAEEDASEWESDELNSFLDNFAVQGVCISAGSACRSHESEPSHVLTAMGMTPNQARDSVRVSFSEFNKSCDVIEAAKIMASCIISLRSECFNG